MTATTSTTASRTYVWKTNTPKIGPTSQRLMVNGLCIGWARLALTRKHGRDQYDWNCHLPGADAKLTSGKCDTLELAQNVCEICAKRWFNIADGKRI